MDAKLIQFGRITALENGGLFDDAALLTLANELDTTSKKVYLLVARFLLLNFPSKSVDSFRIASADLKGLLMLLSRVYDVIIQAKFKHKSCMDNDVVKGLIERAHELDIEPIVLLNEEMKNAFVFNEHTRTFPDRYGDQSPPRYEKEGTIFQWFDRPKKTEKEIVVQLAPTLFKEYALFLEGRWLTWYQLAELWVETGGKEEGLEPFFQIQDLIFDDMRDEFVCEVTHSLTLKKFTYEKTFLALESALGVGPTEDTIRRLFVQQMHDPQFRMDCVFFTGHSRVALDTSREASLWILALQYYPTYVEKWHIPPEWKVPFFEWLAAAFKKYEVAKEPEEVDVTEFLPQVQEKALLIDEENWKDEAFKVVENHVMGENI